MKQQEKGQYFTVHNGRDLLDFGPHGGHELDKIRCPAFIYVHLQVLKLAHPRSHSRLNPIAKPAGFYSGPFIFFSFQIFGFQDPSMQDHNRGFFPCREPCSTACLPLVWGITYFCSDRKGVMLISPAGSDVRQRTCFLSPRWGGGIYQSGKHPAKPGPPTFLRPFDPWAFRPSRWRNLRLVMMGITPFGLGPWLL
jgi:hypothetical protein